MTIPGVSPTTSGGNAQAAASTGYATVQPGANNQAGGYPPPLANGLAHMPPRAGKRSLLGRAAGAFAKGVKGVFQTKDAVPAQKKETVYPDDPVKLRKILHKKYLATRDAGAEQAEAADLGRIRDPASKKFKWGSRDYWTHEIAVARKFLEAEVIAENAKLSGDTPKAIRLRKKTDKLLATHAEYLEVLEKIKEHDPDFYYNVTMANNAFTCGAQLIHMARSEKSLDAGVADPLVNSMVTKMSSEVARIAALRKQAGKFCSPDAVLHGQRWHGHAMFAGIFLALPEMEKSLASQQTLGAMRYMEACMKEWHAVRMKNDDDPAEKNAVYEKVHAALVLLSAHASKTAADDAAKAALEKSEEQEPPEAQAHQSQPSA